MKPIRLDEGGVSGLPTAILVIVVVALVFLAGVGKFAGAAAALERELARAFASARSDTRR
ncbi:MAG TPA: hypothetical protein VNL14_17230 [Candidatus Acidoferrales bacterium]|nr:hypothetical protein [Candidatus Acidoferrales bacterium]